MKSLHEEDKKEKLSREKIINDIKSIYFQYAKGGIAFIFITIIFVGIYILFEISMYDKITMKSVQIFLILLSIVLSSFGIYLYHLNMLKKGHFIIEADYVTDKIHKNTYSNILFHFKSILEQTYKITFAKNKHYTLLANNMEYYKWTNWGMKPKEVFRSTEIGDEFYLVVTKKNRILQIYNKKLFELIDE